MSRRQSKSGSRPRRRHVLLRPVQRRRGDALPPTGDEFARARALITSMEGRMKDLFPGILAKRDDHVLFLLDPESWFFKSTDLQQKLLFGDKPDVVVFPKPQIEKLFEVCLEDPEHAHLRSGLDRLREPLLDGAVFLVVVTGQSIGVQQISFRTLSTGATEDAPTPNDFDARPDPDNPGGYLLTVTVRGVLRVILRTDLAELKGEQSRERVRRFQERARGALAVEALRANPRPEGDVLFEHFHGPALEDALRRGPDDLIEAIERELSTPRS